MAPKPLTATGYAPDDVRLVRSACLSLATYLGTFQDDLVVVGGLVPTLLVPVERLKEDQEAHVGTRDLDLGLSLAILDEARYTQLVDHLRQAGFEPDVTNAGGPANHRWKHRQELVTVDFLIAPTEPGPAASKVRIIEESLSAVLAPGLPLAFRDRVKVALADQTLRGEKASRDIWVCGPGAFMVMKALAFRGRGEDKDAYDLLYVLRNYGESYVAEVAMALKPLLDHEASTAALQILKADFADPASVGLKRAAAFLGRSDDAYRNDLAGAVLELLRLLDR